MMDSRPFEEIGFIDRLLGKTHTHQMHHFETKEGWFGYHKMVYCPVCQKFWEFFPGYSGLATIFPVSDEYRKYEPFERVLECFKNALTPSFRIDSNYWLSKIPIESKLVIGDVKLYE